MSEKMKTSVKRKSVSLPEKLKSMIREKIAIVDGKRLAIQNVPYVIVFYLADKIAWLYRHCVGGAVVDKVGVLLLNFQRAFDNPFPSIYGYDLLAGAVGTVVVKLVMYMKGKNRKKFRQGEEYGSAR